MAVSNLLDLQSSLETRREPERKRAVEKLEASVSISSSSPEQILSNSLVSSTHNQQALLLRQRIPRQLLKSLVLLQNPRDLGGQVVEPVDDGPTSLLLGESVVRELDGHHDEGDVLGSVGLEEGGGGREGR